MNNKPVNYVSTDVIMNKVLKHPLLKDINYEDIIDYTVSVLRIAQVPGIYKSEPCIKQVVNYKAIVPNGSLNIKTVDYMNEGKWVPMRMSTDSLANFPQVTGKRTDLATYSINGNIITTAFKTGKILITFDTLNIDDDGIPMIPDSEALIRAIEAYIKIQVFTVMVDMGKLGEGSLRRAEQEYYWNIGKAQTQFQGFDNEDDMESFINGWKRTFLSQNDHASRYADESQPEQLNIL